MHLPFMAREDHHFPIVFICFILIRCLKLPKGYFNPTVIKTNQSFIFSKEFNHAV